MIHDAVDLSGDNFLVYDPSDTMKIVPFLMDVDIYLPFSGI